MHPTWTVVLRLGWLCTPLQCASDLIPRRRRQKRISSFVNEGWTCETLHQLTPNPPQCTPQHSAVQPLARGRVSWPDHMRSREQGLNAGGNTHFRRANAFSLATCNRSGTQTDQPTRMEECPPSGDGASGEGEPSKSDSPPASWTPNPAGEQAQGKRER